MAKVLTSSLRSLAGKVKPSILTGAIEESADYIDELEEKLEGLVARLSRPDIQPKYKMHQLVEIKSAGMKLEVQITKRTMKSDYDTGVGSFYYDFYHTAKIEGAWSWNNVSEEGLSEMIYDAKIMS